MTTQELKNKIEKVLGNSIRCLLPSYWWKNLFHSVADRIDEVETTITENVNDMVLKSLKEFEAKHPDMASQTLIFTVDETSAEARSNAIKIAKWAAKMNSSPAKAAINPLYVAVPIVDEDFAYSIQTPMYGVGNLGLIFYDVRMPDGQIYNIGFDLNSGVATLQPASSSGGGSVMFVTNPTGDLTEEQKQNNADAYLKVIEAKGAIDININMILFNVKPHMVSVNDNGDLVLVVDIGRGESRFIFTPEGDSTIEEVESDTSGDGLIFGKERYAYVSKSQDMYGNMIETELTEEQRAYNQETFEMINSGEKVYFSYDGTFLMKIGRAETSSTSMFYFSTCCTNSLKADGIVSRLMALTNDGYIALVDTLVGGSSSDITVDTEMSDTSENPVQNKVVFSELQKKQDTISDLADIRSGAALGKTALQSVPSEYVTESELTQKGYATTSQVNDKQNKIDDLEAIRSGAAKGATALQEHQDISHLATKEELNNAIATSITNILNTEV